jgi:hypothetical protein
MTLSEGIEIVIDPTKRPHYFGAMKSLLKTTLIVTIIVVLAGHALWRIPLLVAFLTVYGFLGWIDRNGGARRSQDTEDFPEG